MDFRTTTVAALAERVTSRSVAAREVVEAALDRIERLDGQLGAFVAVDADAALAEARAIDGRLAAGEDVGPLAGVPVGVKDLEDAAGYVTSRGSALDAAGPPATGDSTLVERLRAAGCVVVGKTNTPEHGWKPDTVNLTFGATGNPWSPGRSVGGSSGGSAAAVAAGLVPLATGSDGGGSIRIPAAATGLTALKPSLGRVPSGGPVPPEWPGLSTRGVLTRQARDQALVLDAVVGPEPTDRTSLPLPEASWSRSLLDLHPPRRVAWSPTLGYGTTDGEVLRLCEAAVDQLAEAGTEVERLDTVFAEDPVEDWLVLVGVYCLRVLEPARADPDAWARVDPGLALLVDQAASLPAIRFARAADTGHLLNARLVEVFRGGQLLLTPTVAGQLPPLGGDGTIDGRDDANWVRYTYPFNMTGSPAGTVCVGFTSDGLPVGLQVVGPQHADVAVLRCLTFLEDLMGLEPLAPFGAG
ncbi:MAG TPA: amidase family protein [Acidimicrobiales bacterium]|nr:amidase family protein [Acidimicrobiales bacterium]